MTDTPEQVKDGGWHKPDPQVAEKARLHGAWVKPPNALSEEQLAALRESPPPALPEPEIGAQPAVQGAWYRPSEAQSAAPVGVLDQISSAKPADLAPFALQAEPVVDLGTFDPSRSGVLGGIQAPEPELGEFDSSKSSQLAGIAATETEPAADLGRFDPSLSGALPGIGAGEAAPSPALDAVKSGQLPGLGEQAASVAVEKPVEIQPQVIEQVPPQFTNVEKQVADLRQQFADGKITRQQLQDELRKLMFLDEAGRWWMVGLESNRWYRYDGQNWVPDDPPKQRVVVQAPVPTETGVQQVAGIADQEALGFGATPAEAGLAAGEAGFVPAKVPIEDLGATLVGQAAVRLEDHRSFEAPTQAGMQVTPGELAPADATAPSISAVGGEEEFAPYDFGEAQPAAPSAPYKPKMVGIQPDYSAAFSGYWDRATMQKWAFRAVIFGGVGGLVLLFLIFGGMIGYYLYVVNEYSEAISTLGQRASAFETTIIYDSTGNVLAEFNDPRTGARKTVPLNEISPWVIHATVSTEDETFYENPGFSVYGIIRAIVRNLQTGGAGGGASTITQQLARALVLDPELATQRTGGRKIQEIIVAAEISRKYTKNEILQFYLNEIYYGNLAYGIEAAANVYFGKSAKDLNIAESAFLAGLPQAPAVYDPVVNRETAILRMEDVLRLMVEANGTGCIQMQHEPYNIQPVCVTQAELDDQYSAEIAFVKVKTFSPPTFDARYPHFVNYVYQQLENSYGAQRIYSSGFRVYTTIVPAIQDAAQQALLEEIPVTPNANNGSIVAIRPRDGAILAMVGSADFKNEQIDGQVNVAFTPQQPGSTLKPFVYLTAMEGISDTEYFYPGTILWDVPSCWGNYCPTNFDFSYSGPVSVREALGRSMNIPAVKTLALVTPEAFTATLDRFGIEQPLQTPVEAGLPSALGAIEVYLFDLVQAYATLANQGVRLNPYTITRIENRSGEVIYTAEENPQGVQVVRPEYAYLLANMLSDTTYRESSFLTVPGWRAAAKTGTTNDNRDVWTVGFTPELAVGVWVGRTDNQPMGSGVFGSNTAAPIWNKTMQAGLAGLPVVDFARPNTVLDYQVCDYTGAIYSGATCPGGTALTEVAFSNQPPPSADRGFLTTLKVDSFSGLLANENCPDFIEERSYVNINDLTAIEWLNNNPNGQAFAQAHNIQIPVAASVPPTQSCQPGQPRPQVIISSPLPNQEVSGLTEMRGTVTVPGFTSYEFQIASTIAPEEFSGALGQVYTSQQTSANGLLGVVDFTNIPNGTYILRLVARGQNNATATATVPITVNNIAPIIQPTPNFEPTPPIIEAVPVIPPTVIPTTDAGQGGGSDGQAVPPTSDPFQAVPPTQSP